MMQIKSANSQQTLVLHSFTKQCSLLHLHICIVSIGVHLCVTVQYLHYISDDTRSWMEARPHKRKLLRGGVTHSTISIDQVGLAFSRRQQCKVTTMLLTALPFVFTI